MNLYNTSIVGVINLFVTKNVFIFFFELNYTSRYKYVDTSLFFTCFKKNVVEICIIIICIY